MLRYNELTSERGLTMATINVDSIAKPARAGQNAKAFDELIANHPAEDVIAAVAQLYWDDPAGFFESVEGASSLACTPRDVRTVGAYHYTMHIGGAERVSAELANIWDESGRKVLFFADEDRSECAYALNDEVTWVQLTKGTGGRGRAYAKRARAIAEAVRVHSIDAFVYHQWWNPVLTWDAILLKALGVPVCLFCHTVYEVLFHDYNALEFDHSRVFRYLDAIMTLSEFDQRFWLKFNPRVWVTPNPTTIAPDPNRRSKLDGSEIVWVGRLSFADKQPQEAVRIMAQVVKDHPEAHLTLVGPDATRRERRQLDKLVKRLGIDGNVEFAGPQPDPSRFFARASVHLFTSRLEGWGLVLAESKAYGVPCVMYEMDYLTLTQGHRGIVSVPQGDSTTAAQAISALLEDPERRHELGQEAFDHISEISHVDLAAIWEDAFIALGEGSPKRTGYERDDAQWNLLLDGFKQSADKATHLPLRSYAKRKLLRLLRLS